VHRPPGSHAQELAHPVALSI